MEKVLTTDNKYVIIERRIDVSNNFVILNRFVKSTKKTPKSEIIQATKLLKRYKEEMDNEKKTK